MIEYRLDSMPEVLRTLLEEADAFIGEEDFKGEKTFLIYSSDDISDVLTSLGVNFTAKDTSETNWEEKWKEFIEEGYLTNNIYYVFEPNKVFDDNRKTIHINPSLAFGTGTHATTQIAARLLEGVSHGNTVLDVGTGSGILSIVASISGAKEVDGIDIDPMSLSNCLENLKNNRVSNVRAWTGEVGSITDRTYNVTCANIISSILLSIKEDVFRLSTDYIVFSGILVSEFDEFIDALVDANLVSKDENNDLWHIDETLKINEWIGVRLKK